MSQLPPGSENPFADRPDENPYRSPQGFPQGQTHKPLRPGTVKNYLTEAILCLLCCGGIFAIPAIVYAAQVNPKLQVGDYNGAVRASEKAKMWCIIAVCIGLTCGGASIILQILAGMAETGGF